MSNAYLRKEVTNSGTNMIMVISFLVLSFNLVYLIIKKLCIKFLSRDCDCNSCRLKRAKSYVRSSEVSKFSNFGFYLILFICGMGCTFIIMKNYSDLKDIYQNTVAEIYEFYSLFVKNPKFQNFILIWLVVIILISLALRFIFSQVERKLSSVLERKYHIHGCNISQ